VNEEIFFGNLYPLNLQAGAQSGLDCLRDIGLTKWPGFAGHQRKLPRYASNDEAILADKMALDISARNFDLLNKRWPSRYG